MRTIERASVFKKDYKRIRANPRHGADVATLLPKILHLLINDQPLPDNCRDHALVGNWGGCRECHIKPDILLIYAKPDIVSLRLMRLGSHSELFSR